MIKIYLKNIHEPEPEENASVQLTTGRSGIHLNSSEHVQCQIWPDWPQPLDADSGPSRRHQPPSGMLRRSAQPTAEIQTWHCFMACQHLAPWYWQFIANLVATTDNIASMYWIRSSSFQFVFSMFLCSRIRSPQRQQSFQAYISPPITILMLTIHMDWTDKGLIRKI